ncbi:SDR family NAD(P)-dependent oxidoreductase [Streptomyces sp. AP-93]|uniref:SDR family NAD(P)-dependent oxidoreductase n=1 Tax=Streptomyces sp. AP-93 TaxID=2929048 RepID=UPI001FAF36FF|nr:SDR family NAD(P)-dependent oxidoreductase [Streptomyces sp. AP-93]MCJ0869616.1 SDR family NAD(P)-dependent oxidoreductase [Streptomyces sp. AP-93]
MPSSLSGRTVLVTGATAGIGYETARQLAERGATVLLHGRTPEEARAAADRLIATAGAGVDGSLLRPLAADFARLEEVENLAHGVVREHPRLDVLVNNAAIAAPERHTLTADGNEISFQVNFLAHYLLTDLLAAALTTDPGGRVVNVSSSHHRTAAIQWNDPQRIRRYSRLAAYAQSQLALTVFAADPRVTAVSVHPGICETGLLPLYGNEGGSAAEGAAHVVRLCDPATEIVNGAYYDRGERVAPAPAATDDRTVKRLNKLADLLVGHTA